jgi:uncharacterized RDD family membrane protein YckC
MINKTTKPNIRRRFFAGFIDYTIIFSAHFFLILFLGSPDENGEYHLYGLVGIVPILFWGIMTIGLELCFGATVGNLIVGLKPISINNDGNEIGFTQSFKRHFLDIIDMFCFGLVACIAIKNTEKNQRLGDLWAKTIVVKRNDKMH